MKKPRISEAVGGTGAVARERKRPVSAGRLPRLAWLPWPVNLARVALLLRHTVDRNAVLFPSLETRQLSRGCLIKVNGILQRGNT